MVVTICQELISNESYKCSMLERSAVLTLSKLMCISEAFCIKHMDILIEILKRPKIDAVIKNNVLICLGDL